MQIAIQDGGGNYWGGATFNQAAIFYNATGGTDGAWTYSHRDARRPARQRPHVHDHRPLHRRRRQHRHARTRTFVYDTTAPTVDERHLDERRTAPTGRRRRSTITITFSESVTVTGTPTLALNSGGTANYSSGSGTHDPDLRLHHRPAAEHRRPRLRDHRARSRSAGGTIKDAATNNATLTLADRRRRLAASAARRRSSSTRPTRPPRCTTPPSDGTAYNAASLPGEPRRLLGRHRRLEHGLDRAGRDPGRRRQLLGRRHVQPASIFYNATGGTVGAWTYSTATLAGQLINTPHLHDHRPLDRRGRQHRHDDAHVRLRHDLADRHQRQLLDRRRRLSGRPGRHDHDHLQRERRRHRHPDARAQLRRLGELQRRLRRHDAQLHLHHRAAARTAPTSTTPPPTRSRSPAARSRTPPPTTRP